MAKKTKKSNFKGISKESEKVKTGRAVASFILPPVGIYTYIKEKDQFPKKSKVYGMLAIAGLGVIALNLALKK